MIVNVRESKARMSELLAKVGEGEEVVITVRGRPTARIVPIHKNESPPNRRRWAEELRGRMAGITRAPASSSREIIDDLRNRY